MGSEDGIVDDGSEGKVVEEIGEVLPHIGGAVHTKALIIKACSHKLYIL